MMLEHIGLEVLDIYKMRLFYQKYFNFKLVYSYVSKNTPGLKTVILKNKKIKLELLQREFDNTPLKENKKNIFHLSFNIKDIQKEYQRLKNLGLAVNLPKLTGDGYSEFYLFDPENNMIEISVRKDPEPLYKIDAIIFDFDGTLVDSEENYYKADKILLAEYNINFTEDMKKKYIGTGNLEMMRQIKEAYNIKENIETLLEKKNSIYLDIARKETRVFSEMKKLVEILKRNNYPLAIASGSSPIILKELLSKLNLERFFNVIVSAEDVKKGKPFPDIFIESAERMNVKPENCLVLEDSVYGVEAAKRAFMYCVGIPYLTEKPLNDGFLTADLLFEDGMKSFKADKVFKWIKKKK